MLANDFYDFLVLRDEPFADAALETGFMDYFSGGFLHQLFLILKSFENMSIIIKYINQTI
jgi:hypothetical protein